MTSNAPPPQGPAFELPPPQAAKPVYKRWWFLTGAGVIGFVILISALSGTGGSETESSAPSQEFVSAVMPDLVGQRLDVAVSELALLDIAKRDIEVVGGGTFGALNDAKWSVCEQRPDAGTILVEPIRLIIDRECSATMIEEPVASATESSPELSAPEVATEEVVETEPVPMSPVRFAASARGDLRDLSKDLDDLTRAVQEGGLLRMIGNSLELSFNLGQLRSLEPPLDIAADWETELNALDKRITRVQDAVRDDSSLSTLRKRISAVEGQIATLRNVIKKLD